MFVEVLKGYFYLISGAWGIVFVELGELYDGQIIAWKGWSTLDNGASVARERIQILRSL
jgi:hypothetical protein